MAYKKLLVDLLQPVIENLSLEINILETITNEDESISIIVDDLKWLQPGFKVTIGDNQYTIISIENCTINFKETEEIIAENFNIYKPFFFHGTPRSTNQEITQEADAFKKTPMFWLLDNFEEEEHLDESNPIERETTPQLFALTQGDFDKQYDDIKQDAIAPMSRMMQILTEELRKSTSPFNMRDENGNDVSIRTYRNHYKFGVYITNKGIDKSMFADNLSGVESRIPLRIKRKYLCKEC